MALPVMIDFWPLIAAGHKRKSLWTESIAVVIENAIAYMANFDTKNDDIGGENSHFRKDSYYISK